MDQQIKSWKNKSTDQKNNKSTDQKKVKKIKKKCFNMHQMKTNHQINNAKCPDVRSDQLIHNLVRIYRLIDTKLSNKSNVKSTYQQQNDK